MFRDGLHKTAALKLLKAPKLRMAPKNMAKSAPTRVTTDLQPLNAINGIGGVTGTPELDAPFSRAGFGRGHHKALVPRSNMRTPRLK